jgi:hypothetical protein
MYTISRGSDYYTGDAGWADDDGGARPMCYTCGCKLPYAAHGDPRNIVEDDLVASGRTKTIKNAGRRTAKENMLALLLDQKRRGELDRPRRSYAKK